MDRRFSSSLLCRLVIRKTAGLRAVFLIVLSCFCSGCSVITIDSSPPKGNQTSLSERDLSSSQGRPLSDWGRSRSDSRSERTRSPSPEARAQVQLDDDTAPTSAEVSPKSPWGDFVLEDEESSMPWWGSVLLWLPNRVLDLVDVVRADVGAGMSFGGVVRLTKYGQVGYRSISPVSVRVGAFGRKAPLLIENSSEFGAGPAYVASEDRTVCDGEFGLGLDLFIVGAYGGICVEELLDFAAGLFFIDLSGDDYR